MKKTDYPWRYGWFLATYYMANGIYQGYVSKYFEAAGMSTAQLSVILAATPLVSIFMQPVWGAVADRSASRNRVLRALIAAACAIKVAGYYIAEAVIYQNWIAPAASIPGNLVQIGCVAVVVLAVIVPLKKAAGKVLPAYALS